MAILSAAPVRATPLKLTLLLTADASPGAVSFPITNAVLQAACTGGPLANALNASYASQSAMQDVFGGGSVRMWVRPVDGAFPVGVNVATDLATPSKPRVVVAAAATPPAGTAYLDIEFVHSIVE